MLCTIVHFSLPLGVRWTRCSITSDHEYYNSHITDWLYDSLKKKAWYVQPLETWDMCKTQWMSGQIWDTYTIPMGKSNIKEDFKSPSTDPVSAEAPLVWMNTKHLWWCSYIPLSWSLTAAPKCWEKVPGSTHYPERSWWRAPCHGLSGQLGFKQRRG